MPGANDDFDKTFALNLPLVYLGLDWYRREFRSGQSSGRGRCRPWWAGRFDYEGTGTAQLEIQAWILDEDGPVGQPPVAAGQPGALHRKMDSEQVPRR